MVNCGIIFRASIIAVLFGSGFVACRPKTQSNIGADVHGVTQQSPKPCKWNYFEDPSLNWTKEEKAEIEKVKSEILKTYGIVMKSGERSWSLDELKIVETILPKVPLSFAKYTKAFVRGLSGGSTAVLGFMEKSDEITIYESAMCDMEETVVHEMGHAFANANPAIFDAWKQQFWKDPAKPSGSPTDYGKTNSDEDFAESVEWTVLKPDVFLQQDSARVAFIRKNVLLLHP